MKWTAEMATEAIIDWAKKEITDSTDKLESLVKFLFTVSASSIVAFTAISRLTNTNIIGCYFILAIGFYLLSMFLLLTVLLRKCGDFVSEADLHTEFEEDTKRIQFRCWLWFWLWLIAVIFSGVSIYA